MIPQEYRMSTHEKRKQLKRMFGFVPQSVIKDYAVQRAAIRRKMSENFDVYTEDPNCKSCRKKKV